MYDLRLVMYVTGAHVAGVEVHAIMIVVCGKHMCGGGNGVAMVVIVMGVVCVMYRWTRGIHRVCTKAVTGGHVQNIRVVHGHMQRRCTRPSS